MKRVSVFLILVALIVGMVGCGQTEHTPMVATSGVHMVGLKTGSTVVAVGPTEGTFSVGQCNVGSWDLN